MIPILRAGALGLFAWAAASTVQADCSLFSDREAQCEAQRAFQQREERRSLEERRREEAQQRQMYEMYRAQERQREEDREALKEAACVLRGGRWTYGQCLQ